LRRAIKEPVTFHRLRHGFASWALLRWLACVEPELVLDSGLASVKCEFFTEAALHKFARLLFGFSEPKVGLREISHGLAVTARLLGHSHPLTTVSAYCHTIEVVAHLLHDASRRRIVNRKTRHVVYNHG
jgi:integrase